MFHCTSDNMEHWSVYTYVRTTYVRIYVRLYVRMYVCTYVRMYVCHMDFVTALSLLPLSLSSLFFSLYLLSLSPPLSSLAALSFSLSPSLSLSLSLSLSRLYIPTVWIIYLRQLLYVTFDICSCQTKVQFSE